MRKQVFGRQFKRDTNERKALFKSLATSLVLHERITTTEAKAKAIRPYVEKLVTKARKGPSSVRLLAPYLTLEAVKKMVDDIASRFINRPGGYTRILHAGNRVGDNAPLVVMEWVEKRDQKSETLSKGQSASKEKNQRLKTKQGKEKASEQKPSGDKKAKSQIDQRSPRPQKPQRAKKEKTS